MSTAGKTHLAADGVAADPDLILHMGDYNYRGTSGHIPFQDTTLSVYDAGDDAYTDPLCQLESPYYSQNASDSPVPDVWTNWRDDFFLPANDLLPKAPWIFARGNHELCSRAGPGWFYFLDPGSNLPGAAHPQGSCPPQGSLANPDTDVMSHLHFGAPYAVDLGTLRLLVLDSANACDGYAPEETTQIYTTQYEQLAAAVTAETTTWYMSHRPLWGVAVYSDTSVVNVMLQTALKNTPAGALPSAVSL